MPKIIKNLEESIFESAKELFCEYGYNGVDMKRISHKCSIAVGTLYNYYPNKHSIYIEVFKRSWNETFNKLENIKLIENSYKEYVKKFIEVLYDDIKSRKGIGIQVIQFHCKNDSDLKEIEKNIISRLKTFIEPVKKPYPFNNHERINEKLIYSFLLNIVMLIKEFPENRNQNLNYINYMVESFISL